MKHKKLPKLDLNITNRCNFKCRHCAFDSGFVDMKELTLKQLKKILKDTKDLGGERIDITGGEPTVRKDLSEIIKIAKKLDYKIELVTNGSLLNKKKLIHFKKIGLDALAISLDGSNYKIYNEIRPGSKEIYEKVKKNIKLCVELGFYTKVNTLVCSENLHDLPKITEFCIRNQVNENGIYYFTPVGRGIRTHIKSVEPIQWLNFVKDKLAKYKNKIKLSVEFPMIEKNFVKGNGCIVKEDPFHLQILPDGNVYPCAIMASYHKPIANLHNVSIKKLWNNPKLWKNYLACMEKGIFKECSGSCVNFQEFDISKYKNHKFICPLRKFKVGELKS